MSLFLNQSRPLASYIKGGNQGWKIDAIWPRSPRLRTELNAKLLRILPPNYGGLKARYSLLELNLINRSANHAYISQATIV